MIASNLYFFEPVEKEVICDYTFPEEDVLEDTSLKRKRIAELVRGMAYGNMYRNKMRIFFEDDTSKKVVETTIWGITDDKVVLKSNTYIPINRIYPSGEDF
ncbi:MAG: hypothetical protein J0M25_01230 [Flavobacteriales bacterium]|nr:hypothetical protein [Flavobacteriales bacterium]